MSEQQPGDLPPISPKPVEQPVQRWRLRVTWGWPFGHSQLWLGLYASWGFGLPSFTVALLVVQISISYDYGQLD